MEMQELRLAGATPGTADLVELHAAFCTIFSSPLRLRVMDILAQSEMSVGALAEELGVPMANISQHLRVMRNQGAVSFRREGKTAYYRVANQKFVEGIMKVREGLLEELRKRGRI
ncbi:MAG: helix-turn-helix transcriptional regulator [Deltaproteobacteria bacterium]|nr:helix-turn-helix transcriptional regulator [Deltaproteobacteria bacterium]